MTPASDISHHDDASLPPQPPSAPRDLTRAARRGSWTERHVRVWWILGVTMVIIASYYAISRIYVWSEERRLIEHGAKVEAQVMGWEKGSNAPKNQVVPANTGVDLEYTYKGQSFRTHGWMAGRKQHLTTGKFVSIFIDPEHPERWTGRSEPSSFWQELLSTMLLVPFIILFFAMALWRRREVLRVYRYGEPMAAEVVGIGHSAAAPFSRLLRCAVQIGEESRILKILLPNRKSPGVGQSLWLIAPPDRPQQAVPAILFE